MTKQKELVLRATEKDKKDFLTGGFDDYIHLGLNEIFALVIDITPNIAELLLKYNSENRPLADHTVAGYSRQMKSGWAFTGETIIISKTGKLLNGQHRCQASVNADLSFPCILVFGIDDASFSFMDHGKRRTHADIFSGYGVKNYSTMAAASHWLWRYINSGGHSPNGRVAPNSEELFHFYKKHKDLQNSAWVGSAIARYKLAPPSSMLALHYLCSLKNRQESDIFFKKVCTGIGAIVESDPAIELRNKLVNTAMHPNKHLTPLEISAFSVMAWNAARRKEEVVFIWRTKQRPKQPFPTIL